MQVKVGDKRELAVLEWHRWYAWRPIQTRDGQRVWLRWLWRRGLPLGFGYERTVTFIYELSKSADDNPLEG